MAFRVRGFGTSALLQNTLQSSLPRERGLPLAESSKIGSQKRKDFSPLPMPLRKKKEHFPGRHEEGAENARKYKKIKVNSKTLVKAEAVVTETPLTLKLTRNL